MQSYGSSIEHCDRHCWLRCHPAACHCYESSLTSKPLYHGACRTQPKKRSVNERYLHASDIGSLDRTVYNAAVLRLAAFHVWTVDVSQAKEYGRGLAVSTAFSQLRTRHASPSEPQSVRIVSWSAVFESCIMYAMP